MEQLSNSKLAKFLITVLAIIVLFINANICFSMAQFEQNNALFSASGQTLIKSQSGYQNYKFGLGNIAENGCGVVAVYNILQLDNKNPNLAQVIKDVSMFGLNMFGLLGAFPHGVIMTLRHYGYDVNVEFSIKNFEKTALKYKYNIFLYVGINGGHYEVFYDYNGTDYQIVNPFIRSTISYEIEQTKGYFLKMLISV